MSVTQTFTVTVSNPGAGNRYYIDGVLQKTLNLIEGKTYEFDQSDSSNSNHPLRFSTTSNGTHSGGSEYTTGVTTNGTPGSSGAYTRITVASSAPTLYYYCTQHSGMGGQANTLDGSIMRAYDVTVVSTDSGNKYFINGVQQDTVNLAEGATYYFDQSASSNSNHPLRFSTTSDGTHNSGSEYTTGVTTGGTPGSAGAYTQIAVAASAPTLYYYCTNHSGMGGQANTPAGNSWGVFPWSANQYNDQDSVDVSLTGISATLSVGSVEAANLEGWGRQEWSNGAWGVQYSVELTGVSATTSVGSVVATGFQIIEPTGLEITSSVGSLSISSSVLLTGQEATVSLGDSVEFNETGWGRLAWGQADWGEGADETVSVSGFGLTASPGSVTTEVAYLLEMLSSEASMTAAVGTPQVAGEIGVPLTGVSAEFATPVVAYSGTLVGWGRDAWGDNSWGESPDQVIPLVGREATASVGTPNLAFAYDLTGVSATTNVGSVTFVISPTISVDGQSITSSLGTLGLAFGVSTEPITSVSATVSVGTLGLEFGPSQITGVSATASVGEPVIDATELVTLEGVSATASVGSIVPAIGVPLTGVSATSAVGSFATIPDIIQGLVGIEVTSSVGLIGIQAYGNIDTGSNTSYTSVATGSNTSYSDVA